MSYEQNEPYNVIGLGNAYDYVIKNITEPETYGTFQGDKKSMKTFVEKVNQIVKEKEQLKEYNLRITKVLEDGGVILTKNQLTSLIERKKDDSVEVRHLKSANAKLKDENQSLKNHIQMLQKHIKRLENDNIKTYTLIKEAYKTERTALGKSVLKQLLEAIQ